MAGRMREDGGRGWRRAVVVLMVAAGMATACGSGPPDQPTTLRVLMADDWAGTAGVVAAVREFERANPGVRVQVQGRPFGQIPEAVRAGENFDVAHWHAFAAAAQGLAQPLDELWESLAPEDYLPGAVEGVRWAGGSYGLPLDVNAMVLMVNPDRLAERGIALPDGTTTFDDITRIAAATTDEAAGQRGIAVASSSWSTYGWIRANGGEVVEIEDDGSVTFTLDTPEVIEALDFLGAMVADETAFPPFAQQTSSDAFSLFQAESTAMHVAGMWDAQTLADAPWEVTMLPLPRGVTGATQGSALGGSSLFVPTSSTNLELAVAFMRHLTDDVYARQFAAENGRLPARRAVFDEPFLSTPIYQAVREQLETAHPMRLIAFPDAAAAFTVAIDQVLTGRADAATALAAAQDTAERSVRQPAGTDGADADQSADPDAESPP